MTDRRCVLVGCRSIGEHGPDCQGGRCRGCLPRLVELGLVCNPDRTRLAAWLEELPGLHAELEAEPDPVDRHEWAVKQWRPIPTSDPARRRPWAWVREQGSDVLARMLPMGITRTSHQARVSGSREAPVPVNLDRVDLTGPARIGSMEMGLSDQAVPADQVGYLTVATELDFWVRDWTIAREKSEHLPEPTVDALVSWLSSRLGWACDEHPAIDEFATKIGELRHAMRSVLGLTAAPKELCKGVPCRSCDRKALYREGGGYVTCGHCGQHYSEREYTDWVKLEAPYQLGRVRDGELEPENPDELRRLVA